MGCLMPKKSSHASDVQNNKIRDNEWTSKSYSWSNRDKSQLAKYIIENESNSIQIRMPGEINGEQFIIQNCNNSTICLYDYSNTVSIDDCRECTFFIGPVIGSVVLRNCQDCRLMSASQQFRSRDCKRLYLYLFCATQPAIESCYDLNFSCFQANYKGLQEQFEKANLKIYNNKWFNVYDFSFENREKHWSILPSDMKVNECFCSIPLDNCLNLRFNSLASIVPKTEGINSLDNLKFENDGTFQINEDEQHGIIVVYTNSSKTKNSIESQVGKIIQEINLNQKKLSLLVTKYMDSEQTIETLLSRIFNNNESDINLSGENNMLLKPNQLIILFFRGNFISDKIHEICQRILNIQVQEAKFKLILGKKDETIFNDCLSLVFDNSF